MKKKPIVEKKIVKLKKKGPRFTDLKGIRIFDFNLIPKYLLEQVKGSDINWDTVLKLNNDINSNPLTILYVWADDKNIIKGFLWGELALISERLVMIVLSVDKKYQHSDINKVLQELMREICGSLNIKSCIWCTTRPRAFERVGYIKSKRVLMEIEF